MSENGGGVVRISKNFRELFEKIREQEINRGNVPCSDACVSEILYKRIVNAGGLKE